MRFYAIALFGVLLCLALPARAVPECANEAEREAMAMRALQSEFMLAGVACNQAQAYNAFITKFQPIVSAEGLRLKAYFARTSGGKEKPLNDFITQLANAWSQIHMQDMKGFCTNTWNRMWRLNGETVDRAGLMKQARERASMPLVNAQLCKGAGMPVLAPVRPPAAPADTAKPAPVKSK